MDESFDNQWYAVYPSHTIKKSKPVQIQLHHKKIALWRLEDNSLAAIDDRCPHLGAALATGRIEENRIVCPYHGLRFDKNGRCVHNPGWTVSSAIPSALCVRSWEVFEVDGWVFIYWGEQGVKPVEMQRFDFIENSSLSSSVSSSTREWPVHYTRAAENFLDTFHFFEVHTPFMPFGMQREDQLDVLVKGNLIQNISYSDRERTIANSRAVLPPGLMYPNLWAQSYGKWGHVTAAIVPIGNNAARIYTCSYACVSILPGLNKIVSFLWDKLFSLPLWQDGKVVATQTPLRSDQARDVLTGYDKSIIEYRKLHHRVKRENNNVEKYMPVKESA